MRFPRLATAAIAASALLLAAAGGPALAANADLSVRAVIVSKSICTFVTKSLALPFGTIDQTSGAALVRSVTGSFKCGGSAAIATYALSLGTGLNPTGTGTRRMRNTIVPGEFMSYTLDVTPKSGSVAKNLPVDFTVTGTIQATDFQNVSAGDYEDIVTITLLP